jgi:tetratricopeptide (TPR) repeat protein
MKFSVGLLRITPFLVGLAGLGLNGCLPSAPSDEEKEPYFMAGRSRVNSMDFKGAIDSFEKAVELNPKSAAAHFELGCLYDQKESDPAAAIYHYERYLKLRPNSAKQEMIKTRVQACKQQLAETVSLSLVTEKQQREFEQLAEENKRLRAEVEQWRTGALRQQSSTNPTAATGASAMRASQPATAGQPTAAGTLPSSAGSLSRSPATPPASARAHIVRSGETPTVIARKYGLKVDALMTANPGLDPRRLRIGQILTIPAP